MIVPIQIHGTPLSVCIDSIGAAKGLSVHEGCNKVLSGVRGDQGLFICSFITNQMLMSMLMLLQPHGE
jgi:hypothetical protein